MEFGSRQTLPVDFMDDFNSDYYLKMALGGVID
jgi:hypothetical protein